MKRIDHDSLVYYDGAVSRMISSKYGMSMMEAFRQFVSSTTHEMLEDSSYWLVEFGPGGVFDMWEAERVTGDPRNSVYVRGE